MNKESRSLNLMNAEHVALLAYMQRYIQSITKEGKRPGDLITLNVTSTSAQKGDAR